MVKILWRSLKQIDKTGMVSDKPSGKTLRKKLDGGQPSWNSGTHYLSYAAEFISNFLRKLCQKIYVIYSA